MSGRVFVDKLKHEKPLFHRRTSVDNLKVSVREGVRKSVTVGLTVDGHGVRTTRPRWMPIAEVRSKGIPGARTS